MEETAQNEANEIKPVSDTLLVLSKDTTKIEMVKGVDKDGNLQKFPPKEVQDNDQLIRVDKHGDIFTNFFSNFYRQLKNPSHFNFCKISEYDAVNTAKDLQNYVDQASPEEKEKLKEYAIQLKNTNPLKNQNTMENNTETQEYRFQPEQIDWKTMQKFGLNQEKLEKMNALDPLLRGFKTNNLIPITINLGTAVSKMDVRLSLQTADNGEVAVNLHGIRKEPNYNLKFLGHEFTDEDKKNLKESGNMGRVVDLVNPKTDEIIPSVISRDRLTNELVAYRAVKNIDWEDEEEDWQYHDDSKIESGFATGVTFQELSTAGQLLQQDLLEPGLEQQAVNIIQKIQGTELFDLLKNSLGDASKRVANLLSRSISDGDERISLKRKDDAEGFDIGEFI